MPDTAQYRVIQDENWASLVDTLAVLDDGVFCALMDFGRIRKEGLHGARALVAGVSDQTLSLLLLIAEIGAGEALLRLERCPVLSSETGQWEYPPSSNPSAIGQVEKP